MNLIILSYATFELFGLPLHYLYCRGEATMFAYHKSSSSTSLPYSSSRSISSSGRRCPDVSVLRHSACCCHRTKRMMSLSHLCLGFPRLLFPPTIPGTIVFSKPLWRVTWSKYFSFSRLTKLYIQFVGR